ncbi:ABC-three component system middle component 6 [Photobacterium leiognathi]|uniref:ABC-three component system middle component 6 n=1 Tax=Photobacterium leiognathi TaxID=553611 RepID=UPI002732B9DF|nr:ABC-three component system middle component 6 [Photobacterium leiognathi]
MLLNNFSTPKQSLIIIGSNIITIFNDEKLEYVEIKKLYNSYNNLFGFLSYSYFMLGLDFLFIVGYIELNENGVIELCK